MQTTRRTAGSIQIGLYSLFIASGAASAQIEFEDVSAHTGMTGNTETWGGSWGDINTDNWPDIFNQGHREYPRIFRNTGDGSFENIAYELDPGNWIAFPFDDKHGVSFADYDNDGDDDILVSVSATGPAQFLVNDDGVFTDRAIEADLQNDQTARLGTWFDYSGDGHLDLLQAWLKNGFLRTRDPVNADEPRQYQNRAYDFDDERIANFTCEGRLNYAQLFDIDGDGSLEVLCIQEGIFPLTAYNYTNYPIFEDVSNALPSVSHVNDTITADFDNDLLYDMVLTRGALRPSGAALIHPHRIEAWLRKDETAPPGKGFTFKSPWAITVTVDHKDMGIYESSKVFQLSPIGNTSASVALDDSDESMRIEWDAAKQLWRVSVIETVRPWQAYLQINTVAPITNLREVGLDNTEFPYSSVLLENSADNGLQQKPNAGLNSSTFCVSAAAADFDNDMDVDLYLVCRRGVENYANRLYENQGDGTFVEVTGHGAEGPVGAGLSVGVGESVVTADYDVDGFIDLYVTNGLLYFPVNRGGPENLFRNKGNDNNWLELDLQGVVSNRDGVGAKVYVTAGGITQLREQNGGYHRWSQNHTRLHFGLADNPTADIRIEWPSGLSSNFLGVAANALYVAPEVGLLHPATLGPPVHTDLEPGDECGEPPYHFDYGPAVLLWKDCSNGVWSLRTKGGREQQSMLRTAGSVAADKPITGVTAVNLNSSDVLDTSTPSTLDFDVGAWFANDKGFNFSTADQSSACFSLDVQDIPSLIVGGSRKKVSWDFDLVSLDKANCDASGGCH